MIALPPWAALFPRAASYPQAATGSAEMLDRARVSAAAVRGHPAQSRARPFQAAQAFQDAAQAHLVLPAASAQELALPLEESAAWGAAAVLQQVAAARGAAGRRSRWRWRGRGAVRAPEARRGGRRGAAAGRGSGAVPLRGAVLRAAPDAQVAEPRAARPSAAPWVFRRDQALPWPAPQPAVRFARAMQCLQIALP